MSIKEKLMHIQSELKAPKGQYNSFGKYNYRSCEDIVESVKPLLLKYNCILTLSDEVIGFDGRFYVKATATISDTDEAGEIFNCGYAREDESKKGMDGSQITGTSSSYARKYALNGLFCIDDTKDADSDENHNQQNNVSKVKKETPTEPLQKQNTGQDSNHIIALINLAKLKGVEVKVLEKKYQVENIKCLTDKQYYDCTTGLQKMADKVGE